MLFLMIAVYSMRSDVCNMHELRWNFFFVQGVLVPGGQPNL